MDSTEFRSEFHNRRERLKMERIINPSNSSGYYHNSTQDLSVSGWENPLVVHHYNPNFGNPDTGLDYPHYGDNLISMNNVGDFCLSNGSVYIQGQENVYNQNSQMNLVTVASSGTGNGNSPRELDDSSWMNRPVGMNVNRWNETWSCNVTPKCDQEPRMFLPGSGRQGLSLSLSSDPISGKSSGKPLHEVMVHGSSSGNANNTRHIAPLGPFTGYATILKSSRFLKPAQEMLDEVCSICVGSRLKDQGATEVYGDDATVKDDGAMRSDDSGDLFSTHRSCNEIGKSSSFKCSMSEYQEVNAKLMRLLDEVCRRYRLHNEQIQMVVSSFESVAGLNSATPFISLALKRIAKSFQRLKTTISNHLKLISNSFKDKNTTINSSTINNNSLQNQKYPFEGNVESQQHIWRPQRGLPERAVGILRAWLFDHFLHPYPTDTDKQMLATQTGLSRNQVSNWFINARVRVWKPMVEEIHTLETKGMSTTTTTTNRNRRNVENKEMMNARIPTNNGEIFKQEKRLRADYTRNGLLDGAATSSSSSSMMGLGLNQRNGFEIGVGNVSLTLGLRYGVEGIQQPQQQQEQQLGMMVEDRFGNGHMLHDLMG